MSKEARDMNPTLAIEIAEGYGEGEDATPEETQAAWQYLLDTGLCFQLQGWFGRTARDLVQAGIIKDNKNHFGGNR